MEFSGQRRPPSSYQRSLWREDVGCIENRRATDVPKVSARWNRTGYAVCTDLSVCNRGRRMFYLPEERLSKECGSPQLFSAVLNNVKTSTSCRCTNEFASVQGAWKRSVASGNTCAVAINFRNFLSLFQPPTPHISSFRWLTRSARHSHEYPLSVPSLQLLYSCSVLSVHLTVDSCNVTHLTSQPTGYVNVS